MDVVKSVNGVPIRLTDERWEHIVRRHRNLSPLRALVLTTVGSPTAVALGKDAELLAIGRESGRWIVVAYREVGELDGFIITAFLSRSDPARGREIAWPST